MQGSLADMMGHLENWNVHAILQAHNTVSLTAVTTLSLDFQNFSITGSLSPSPYPPAPGTAHPTFCFCEFSILDPHEWNVSSD